MTARQLQDPAPPIPISRTTPAVDLTVLFQGFKPLIQGLAAERDQQAVARDHPHAAGRGRRLELAASRRSATSRTPSPTRTRSSVTSSTTSPRCSTAVGQRDRSCRKLIVELQQLHLRPRGRPDDDRQRDRRHQHLATSTAGLLTQVRGPLAKDITDVTGCSRSSTTTAATLKHRHPAAARHGGRADPHRHLRLVVQLLPLRRIERHAHSCPAARSSTLPVKSLSRRRGAGGWREERNADEDAAGAARRQVVLLAQPDADRRDRAGLPARAALRRVQRLAACR